MNGMKLCNRYLRYDKHKAVEKHSIEETDRRDEENKSRQNYRNIVRLNRQLEDIEDRLFPTLPEVPQGIDSKDTEELNAKHYKLKALAKQEAKLNTEAEHMFQLSHEGQLAH